MTKYQQELSDLTDYFKAVQFPKTPFFLNKYLQVHDVQSVIDFSTKEIQRYHGSDKVLDSLFKHLRELKEYIESQKTIKYS